MTDYKYPDEMDYDMVPTAVSTMEKKLAESESRVQDLSEQFDKAKDAFAKHVQELERELTAEKSAHLLYKSFAETLEAKLKDAVALAEEVYNWHKYPSMDQHTKFFAELKRITQSAPNGVKGGV